MTTEKMLEKIEAKNDFSDCVLLVGSFASLKFNLACLGDEVWGTGPRGDIIETTRAQMVSDYDGCAWTIQIVFFQVSQSEGIMN